VLDIELPPLRARGRDEIVMLAEHFTALYCARYEKPPLRLSATARTALEGHPWPGNVRELEHAIQRAVIMSRGAQIDADALGLGALGARAVEAGERGLAVSPGTTLDALCRAYAKQVVEAHRGNKSAAARALGISRNRLARLLAP
jgi:Nif-specific regulatory protein